VKTKGSWADFHADTVRGTEQLLEAVHKAGTPRFVHVSSIGIYRANEGDTINESTPFDDGEDDRGFYTQAKIQAEEAVWRAYRERQLPVIVIRPGLLYGPGRSPMLARLRVPARLFTLAIARRRQLLPLAYVDNVADGISLALHADQSVVGRAYNVIDGEVPQDEYVAALRQARLWPKRTIFLPPAAFYPVVLGVELAFGCLRRTPPFSRHRFSRALASARYETSRARMELGWTSKVPLAEGLARVRAARV
jgi:nucleoside-diphosphate-sugar epimerase